MNLWPNEKKVSVLPSMFPTFQSCFQRGQVKSGPILNLRLHVCSSAVQKITICGCSIFHTFKWVFQRFASCWSYRVKPESDYPIFTPKKLEKPTSPSWVSVLAPPTTTEEAPPSASNMTIPCLSRHETSKDSQGLCCPIGAKWSRNLAQETLMANSGILCSQRCPRHWFSRSSATWTISVASKTSRQLPNLYYQDPVAKGQQCYRPCSYNTFPWWKLESKFGKTKTKNDKTVQSFNAPPSLIQPPTRYTPKVNSFAWISL